jgi:hypothetical protein
VHTALLIGGAASSYAVAMKLVTAWQMGGDAARFLVSVTSALMVVYVIYLGTEPRHIDQPNFVYGAGLAIETMLAAISVYLLGKQFSVRDVAGMTMVAAISAPFWA